MNVLYIGDIMGSLGIEVVRRVLPDLKKEKQVDLVIAQAENTTNGKGINPEDFQTLRGLGIDFCTGGNWSLHDPEIIPLLNDPQIPIIRPANYPDDVPGKGYKMLSTPKGKVLIVSLLGQIVGKDAERITKNPLSTIDEILELEKNNMRTTIVNFHGDFSSEKRVIGYYLDGRVGAVIGDHWHVPTADAMLLPKSTAHMTDVGMCGSLDSSLGIKLDVIINRWRDGKAGRNVLETSGRTQFNAVLVTINDTTGLATKIEPIQRVFEH